MISIRSIKKPSIKTIIPGPKSKELLKNKDEFVPQQYQLLSKEGKEQ